MSRPSLADELATPLAPAELRLVGCSLLPVTRAGLSSPRPTGRVCSICAGQGWRQPRDRRRAARLCWKCKGQGRELPRAAIQRRRRERSGL